MDKIAAIFTDNIFKCIFMNETYCISIWISLKFAKFQATPLMHSQYNACKPQIPPVSLLQNDTIYNQENQQAMIKI